MSKYHLRNLPDPARLDPPPRPAKAAAPKAKPANVSRDNLITKTGRTRAEERARRPSVAKRNK